MNEITTIGLDLAKNVFQIHGVGLLGQAPLRRQLRRAEVLNSLRCHRAWLAWRRVRQLIIGPERSPKPGMS